MRYYIYDFSLLRRATSTIVWPMEATHLNGMYWMPTITLAIEKIADWDKVGPMRPEAHIMFCYLTDVCKR